MSKVILYFYLVYLTMDSYCWITDINTKMLNEVNGAQTGEKGITITFPGTKWCGPGNNAKNYDDLGTEMETDMCCREHDNCPDLIPGGGTKHNLTNTSFFTRLNCSCDNKLYACLKASKEKAAEYVGLIYFNTLQTQCFREDYPVTGCTKRGGLLKTKCLEYSYDTSGEIIYQWFDVPDF